MRTLNDVLTAKGTDVYVVRPDQSAWDAVTLMSETGVGSLLVMDGDKLAGIVSERDIARKVTMLDRPARQVPASEIMTARVTIARPDTSVEEGMAIMTERRVRHLPVIEGERVVGVVSIGDLVKAVIDEQKFTIDQLEHYIHS